MNFKKIVSAVSALAISVSAFAGLAVTASAAAGEVTTIYSENFETAESYAADSKGGNTDFGITTSEAAKSLTTKVLKISGTASGSSKYLGYTKALKDNTAEEKALSTYPNVTLDFDVEALNKDTKSNGAINLAFADSDNNTLVDIAMAVRKNWGTNTVTDASGTQTQVTGKVLHFNIAMDFVEKTQTIVITDTEGNQVGDTISVTGMTQKNFNGFYYPNTGWRYGDILVDNIVITTEEVEAKLADYTVNYMDGTTLITSKSLNGNTGVSPIVPMDSFIIGDVKYSCDSNDLGEKTILEDGSLEVNVQCTANYAAASATISYVYGGAEVASEAVTLATGYYTGDTYYFNYRRYAANNGVLYQSSRNGNEYKKSAVLTDNTIVEVAVEPVTVADGETFVTAVDGDGDTGNNAGIRASNGSAKRGMLVIGNVEPGIYKIVFTGYLRRATGSNGPELYLDDTSLGVMETTAASAWTTDYTESNITVTTAGTLSIHDCDMMDTVVLYKTGEYVAPVEPSVSAVGDLETVDGVDYMTFKATTANVDDTAVTKSGFAFINAADLETFQSEKLSALWTENAISNHNFGAAIEKITGATSSIIYAIPYIVGDSFAKLGNVVPSVFRK